MWFSGATLVMALSENGCLLVILRGYDGSVLNKTNAVL